MPRLTANAVALPTAQVAQAGVNFLFILGAARELPVNVFAFVSVVWIVYAVMLTAQRSLLSEPALVDIVKDPTFPVLQTTLPGGVVSGLLFALCTGAAGSILGVSDVGIAVAMAGGLLLLNDVVRYVYMATGNSPALLATDATCLVACLLGFFGATITNNPYWILLAPVVGASISLIAGRQLVWPKPRLLIEFVRGLGGYFPWTSAQVLVANLASQFIVLLTLPMLGAGGFAGLRAMQASLSPISTPATALQPLAIAITAKSAATFSTRVRFYVIWTGGMLPLLAALAWLAGVTAETWIPALLGPGYSGFNHIVSPIVLTFGMTYIGLPIGAQVKVARLGRESAVAQILSVCFGFVIVLISTSLFGLAGAAWGLFAQSFLSIALAYAFVIRSLQRHQHAPASKVI